MYRLSQAIGDGAAHAAPHHADPLGALRQLGGDAQGAHKVPDVGALLQIAQQLGGQTHLLEDDGDGALLPVVVADGQGDALPVLIHPQNDKLARLGLLGDEGSLHLQQGDAGVENLFSYNFKHFFNLFLLTARAPSPGRPTRRFHHMAACLFAEPISSKFGRLNSLSLDKIAVFWDNVKKRRGKDVKFPIFTRAFPPPGAFFSTSNEYPL